MKPPLTYYGGKQMLSKLIVSLIPKHNLYCEPFFGGGAVFFAKEPSAVEIINDTNGELINFYKVIKTQFKKLEKEIKSTLHSREHHQVANIVLLYPQLFDEIKRAWAIWTSANQSFGSMLGSTWKCDFKQSATPKLLRNKRENFTNEYAKRLEQTQIECRDAIEVIRLTDSKETFFYIDPPYFNSNMGHYKKYTKEDFEKLLQTLSEIKGKFLLSSYPSPMLDKYIKKHKWFTKEIDKQLCLSAYATVKKKRKIEVLTGNYGK
jgi:DNA adenine methylase